MLFYQIRLFLFFYFLLISIFLFVIISFTFLFIFGLHSWGCTECIFYVYKTVSAFHTFRNLRWFSLLYLNKFSAFFQTVDAHSYIYYTTEVQDLKAMRWLVTNLGFPKCNFVFCFDLLLSKSNFCNLIYVLFLKKYMSVISPFRIYSVSVFISCFRFNSYRSGLLTLNCLWAFTAYICSPQYFSLKTTFGLLYIANELRILKSISNISNCTNSSLVRSMDLPGNLILSFLEVLLISKFLIMECVSIWHAPE